MPALPSHIVAGTSQDYCDASIGPCQYCTPCRRYSVERTSAERFEVYGPDDTIVEWFVTLADAKECADGQAEKRRLDG